MKPGCQVQDQLSTNEPTASYIIGREINLRKLLGRQWESNPQPPEQTRVSLHTGKNVRYPMEMVVKYMRYIDRSPMQSVSKITTQSLIRSSAL